MNAFKLSIKVELFPLALNELLDCVRDVLLHLITSRITLGRLSLNKVEATQKQ